MANKTWSMNDTQKAFVKEVAAKGEKGCTLFELKLEGKNFASGSVNTLVKQGVLTVDDEDRVFECDVMFEGVKVGTVKKTAKVFRLVNKD